MHRLGHQKQGWCSASQRPSFYRTHIRSSFAKASAAVITARVEMELTGPLLQRQLGDESLRLPYPVSENYITCRDVACIQKLYRKYVHPLKKHLNDGDSFSYWDPEIMERMNHLLRNASPMSEVSIRSKKLGGQDKAFYVQMLPEDLCILYKESKGYD